MTRDEKIIRNKVGVLELAKQLGSSSQACRIMGFSPRQISCCQPSHLICVIPLPGRLPVYPLRSSTRRVQRADLRPFLTSAARAGNASGRARVLPLDADQKLLKANGILASMSRKGNCGDNAPMESWFHTVKTELVHHTIYATCEAAKRELLAYIEGYYNRQRLHSALGYLTPDQAEFQAA